MYSNRNKTIYKSLLLVLVPLMLLVTVGFTYYYLQNFVTVTADSHVYNVNTFKKTTVEVLSEIGLKLNDADLVKPTVSSEVFDGMEISVIRAFPVTVSVGGQETKVITTPDTVSEVLKRAGVSVNDGDKVSPSLNDIVQDPTKVEIIRVTTKELEEIHEIPYSVVREDDENMARGLRRITQQGEPGKESVLTRITYENGKEVSREIVDKEVIKEPREQLVAMGTVQTYSRGSENFRFKKAIEVVATGYTHTGNPTFTGVYPQVGTIAVDPKVIPLGTKLFIEGYGKGIAQDTGGYINGNRIDLFFDSREEALTWGRRKIKAYIIE